MAVPYPSLLPAPQYKGYKNTQTQNYYTTKMDYATKIRAKFYGNFKANLTFKFNQDQLGIFEEWYYSQLNAGSKPFEATWLIAGVKQLMEFVFDENGQPEFDILSPTIWEVKINVIVKTDIFELLANNNLNGFCPDIIECQENLINFAVNYTAS